MIWHHGREGAISDIPSENDWDLELWDEINLSVLYLLCRVFSHSTWWVVNPWAVLCWPTSLSFYLSHPPTPYLFALLTPPTPSRDRENLGHKQSPWWHSRLTFQQPASSSKTPHTKGLTTSKINSTSQGASVQTEEQSRHFPFKSYPSGKTYMSTDVEGEKTQVRMFTLLIYFQTKYTE